MVLLRAFFRRHRFSLTRGPFELTSYICFSVPRVLCLRLARRCHHQRAVCCAQPRSVRVAGHGRATVRSSAEDRLPRASFGSSFYKSLSLTKLHLSLTFCSLCWNVFVNAQPTACPHSRTHRCPFQPKKRSTSSDPEQHSTAPVQPPLAAQPSLPRQSLSSPDRFRSLLSPRATSPARIHRWRTTPCSRRLPLLINLLEREKEGWELPRGPCRSSLRRPSKGRAEELSTLILTLSVFFYQFLSETENSCPD